MAHCSRYSGGSHRVIHFTHDIQYGSRRGDPPLDDDGGGRGAWT